MSDLHHFFRQITIPIADRRYFSARAGKDTYELCALPMGWSWSPWVAQGIAIQVALRAIAKSGWASEPGPSAPDSPPPYVAVRDGQGRLVAFVVVWYDNYLVLANDKANHTTLMRAIDAELRRCKITYKMNEQGAAWTVERGRGEFIGIQFRHADDGFEWRHIEANVTEWAGAGLQPRDTMPLMEVARAIGVLVWDSAVRLGSGKR